MGRRKLADLEFEIHLKMINIINIVRGENSYFFSNPCLSCCCVSPSDYMVTNGYIFSREYLDS